MQMLVFLLLSVMHLLHSPLPAPRHQLFCCTFVAGASLVQGTPRNRVARNNIILISHKNLGLTVLEMPKTGGTPFSSSFFVRTTKV